jgi:HemY protein
LPQRVRDYRTRRQQEQAGAALRDTLLAYFEGRLGRAERFARNAQASRDTAAPAALIAARAAHRMNERERRDQWLAEVGADQGAASALQMTQAELAVDDRRSADAIEILERLQAGGARHIVAMRTARDATLSAPTLLLPSIQVNMRAGRFPAAEANGVRYLLIPVRLPDAVPV